MIVIRPCPLRPTRTVGKKILANRTRYYYNKTYHIIPLVCTVVCWLSYYCVIYIYIYTCVNKPQEEQSKRNRIVARPLTAQLLLITFTHGSCLSCVGMNARETTSLAFFAMRASAIRQRRDWLFSGYEVITYLYGCVDTVFAAARGPFFLTLANGHVVSVDGRFINRMFFGKGKTRGTRVILLIYLLLLLFVRTRSAVTTAGGNTRPLTR